jgi:hypothetical protein
MLHVWPLGLPVAWSWCPVGVRHFPEGSRWRAQQSTLLAAEMTAVWILKVILGTAWQTLCTYGEVSLTFRWCCGLNVSPSKFMCRNVKANMVVLRWETLKTWLGHEGSSHCKRD